MVHLGIVSLLWAFSFGLIGSALAGVDSFFVSTVRLGCATLLFLPFVRLHKLGTSDRLRLVVIGAIQFGVMYACYMPAFQYLPSHQVALFSIFTPVYVVVIHSLRNQFFSCRYLVAAILAIMGAGAIKAESIPTGDFWVGFGLMQLANLSFAYGQVAYREWKIKNKEIPDQEVFSMLTIGGVFIVGLASFILTDWSTLEVSESEWTAILYLGFVASGLGFYFWNKGASRTNPGLLAAFNNGVVPLAVLISLYIFGESESFSIEKSIRLIIGSLLIIAGIFTATK